MFNFQHKFKTEKQTKTNGIMRFVAAFLAFALVFGSISLVIMLKHNDTSLKDFIKGKALANEAEDTTLTTVVAKEISGSADFLLYCTDNESSDFYFLVVVTADMDKKEFRVRPLKNDYPEYIAQYKSGGSKALISAVEKREKLHIDKYIGSNADTFVLAINYMGGLEYTVDNRVEYRTDDYTLILTKGSQTIKGDSLIRYFRYADTLGNAGLQIQGKLIATMLDGYIQDENVEKGLTIYQKVLSKIHSDCDISYIEASKGIEILRTFCKSDNKKPASVIINAQ